MATSPFILSSRATTPVRGTTRGRIDDVPTAKTWENFITSSTLDPDKSISSGVSQTIKDLGSGGPLSSGLGAGSVMGDWERYKYPSKTESKSAFTDALGLTQQMAHGVDRTMDMITNEQVMLQRGEQGAASQELQQRMAQAGVSDARKFVLSGMQERDQGGEQTSLLSQLAQQRAERARQATADLANMSVQGRQLEAQEETMMLQDKWTQKELELKEKNIDIEAEYKRRALELEQQGLSLQAINTMLEEEFGRSQQNLNWAELALKDEQFVETMKLDREKWETYRKQIEAQTYAQNIDNYMNQLQFLDITTPDGMAGAETLFLGIFGDSDGSRAMFKSLDFADLQDAKYDARYESNMKSVAATVANNKDAFRDATGTVNFFNQDGTLKDPAMSNSLYTAYQSLMRNAMPKNADGSTMTFDQMMADPTAAASFRQWANTNLDDYVYTTGEQAANEQRQRITAMVNKGSLTQADAERYFKGIDLMEALNVTGNVVFTEASDGSLIIKDTQGNVLYTESTSAAVESGTKLTVGQSISIPGYTENGITTGRGITTSKDDSGNMVITMVGSKDGEDVKFDAYGNAKNAGMIGDAAKVVFRYDVVSDKWIADTVDASGKVTGTQDASKFKEWNYIQARLPEMVDTDTGVDKTDIDEVFNTVTIDQNNNISAGLSDVMSYIGRTPTMETTNKILDRLAQMTPSRAKKWKDIRNNNGAPELVTVDKGSEQWTGLYFSRGGKDYILSPDGFVYNLEGTLSGRPPVGFGNANDGGKITVDTNFKKIPVSEFKWEA